MDPARQTAQLARDALLMVRRSTATRLRISAAQRKLLTLRRVLRRLLEGASPDQINLDEIDSNPVGIAAGVYLQGALYSLAYEALIHARAGVVIFLYGAVHHPNLRGTASWQEWCDRHDITAEHVAGAIQRLRHALAQFTASVRAVDMATTSYPRLSADWITLVLAAEQHAYNASIDAEEASREASQMGLAISLEHHVAGSLLADGDV